MVSTIATNEAHYSSFTSHHKQTNKQQATAMSTANNTNSTAHFEPNGEIDLDGSLYPRGMDWGFDKPDVPHTTVYIFNKEEEEEEEEDDLTCSVCDSNIPRNSCDHDQSILVNCGDDIICPDCPWVCEAKCGECTVCEDERDEEEEEADKPATTETPSDKGKQ